jgi:hypothetical protein
VSAHGLSSLLFQEKPYLALGVDVANIGSDTYKHPLIYTRQVLSRLEHTGSQADIVERELANPGVELEQQRQGLTNTTGSTENGDLG